MEAPLLGIANLDIYISLAILLVLLVSGVPLPISFLAPSIFLIYLHGLSALGYVSYSWDQLSSILWFAVPLFIMAGGLMGSAGLAERLVAIADTLVGRIRGGLGSTMVVACAFTGAIAGNCSAAVAAIGSIMIPQMEEHGYSRGYSSALVACASVLGQLIPPSIPMIAYAFVTRQSVLTCWLATVGPGILLIIIYGIINYFLLRNNPNIKTPPPASPRQQVKKLTVASYRGFFALLMPLIVLGGIYGGLVTTVEAGAVAVVYSALVGLFIYCELNWKGFLETLVSTCTTTGVVVLMIFFVMIFSRLYVALDVPQHVINLITSFSVNKYVMLLAVNVLLLLVGMIVDDFTGTLLVATLVYPVVVQMGVDPIHFAAIVGTNLGLGNITPPTAPILYLAARVGNVGIDKMAKTALIFGFCGSLPVVLVTTYWPALSLFLPRLFMSIGG